MRFTNGEYCHGKHRRSMTVNFTCGPHTELIAVDEISVCIYNATVTTPAACHESDLAELLQEIDNGGDLVDLQKETNDHDEVKAVELPANSTPLYTTHEDEL
eukprot:GHVT01023888.1.p1 GENE.GHVT01023888.1~~GHVT01023888.1.p1  ORF type:complete len:102 (-),score=9.18 GHVT01023888.1:967-1272(-)